MKPDVKKLVILNLPYLFFVYLFGKCGQAYRLAAGADLSGKLLHLADGFTAAFANPLPSLQLFDFCVGVAGALIVRLVVYCKGKNAKKYRKRIRRSISGSFSVSGLGISNTTTRPCQLLHRWAILSTKAMFGAF